MDNERLFALPGILDHGQTDQIVGLKTNEDAATCRLLDGWEPTEEHASKKPTVHIGTRVELLIPVITNLGTDTRRCCCDLRQCRK